MSVHHHEVVAKAGCIADVLHPVTIHGRRVELCVFHASPMDPHLGVCPGGHVAAMADVIGHWSPAGYPRGGLTA